MPKSVLVVDPFTDERELYSEALATLGWAPIASDNAVRALQLAFDFPVAAVITRIRQAGPLDGIELTRRLKANRRTSRIPVLIITTHMSGEIRAAAEEAGCDAYLLLPVMPDALALELSRQVGRAEEAAGDA